MITKNKTIWDFVVNHAIRSINITSPDSNTTLKEMGLDIPQLKEDISNQAIAEARFSRAGDWAKWFNYSEADKSALIKSARKEAQDLIK